MSAERFRVHRLLLIEVGSSFSRAVSPEVGTNDSARPHLSGLVPTTEVLGAVEVFLEHSLRVPSALTVPDSIEVLFEVMRSAFLEGALWLVETGKALGLPLDMPRLVADQFHVRRDAERFACFYVVLVERFHRGEGCAARPP